MNIEEAVTYLYKMFKGWSERKFSADDVTWCEVKGALENVFKDKETKIAALESQLKEANESNDILEKKLAETEEALRIRSKQIGVACLEHDLVHSLKCGRCYSKLEQRLQEAEELLSRSMDSQHEYDAYLAKHEAKGEA